MYVQVIHVFCFTVDWVTVTYQVMPSSVVVESPSGIGGGQLPPLAPSVPKWNKQGFVSSDRIKENHLTCHFIQDDTTINCRILLLKRGFRFYRNEADDT